ncbi:GTPase-activating protein [Wickerhamiella sorbophila]|uniref:GTPase-activating protein n=1 Tax=Wickerhamiella sorbophila TaxID=45607 RepID=A0A2T0FDV5_9ASCO|nr:GTPase-activating protein [Wickerhamiella sorbophila]PRT53183.1 GTPase-activating protein [Wickerhamiella sorbophila]
MSLETAVTDIPSEDKTTSHVLSDMDQTRLGSHSSVASPQISRTEDVKQTIEELKLKVTDTAQINRLLQCDMEVLEKRVFNRYASSEVKAARTAQQDIGSDQIHIGESSLRLHGRFLGLLQSNTQYLADLAHRCSLSEIDEFLEILCSNIYGNQFNQHEEQLWLLTFLQVLARQFESTREFSSLLRSNSAAPRMMTSFAQRIPGQSYLREVLTPMLEKVLEIEESLDIGPLSIFNELREAGDVSSDPFNLHAAEEHPDYGRINEVAEKRYSKLKELIMTLLQSIFSSVDQVPYGMRWISKQIDLLARLRFQQASKQQTSSLLVGTFFLRYINPAILFPEKYLELKAPLTATAKRNLTVLARVIQMIANQTSQHKKIFIVNMRPFLQSLQGGIASFFENLCNVPDFFHYEQLDHYLSFVSSDNQIIMKPKKLENLKKLVAKYPPRSEALKRSFEDLEDLEVTSDPVMFNLSYEVAKVWWPIKFERSEELAGFLVAKSVLVDGFWANESSTSLAPDEIIASTANSYKRDVYKAAKTAFEEIRTKENLLNVLLDEVHLEVLRLGPYSVHLDQEVLKLEHALSVAKERNMYLRTQIKFLQKYLRASKHSMKHHSPITNVVLSANELHMNKILQYWTFEPHLWPMLYFQLRKTNHNFTLALHFRERLPPLLTFTFTLPDLLTLEEDTINLRCLKLARVPLINMLQRRLL